MLHQLASSLCAHWNHRLITVKLALEFQLLVFKFMFKLHWTIITLIIRNCWVTFHILIRLVRVKATVLHFVQVDEMQSFYMISLAFKASSWLILIAQSDCVCLRWTATQNTTADRHRRGRYRHRRPSKILFQSTYHALTHTFMLPISYEDPYYSVPIVCHPTNHIFSRVFLEWPILFLLPRLLRFHRLIFFHSVSLSHDIRFQFTSLHP